MQFLPNSVKLTYHFDISKLHTITLLLIVGMVLYLLYHGMGN